MGFKKLDIDNKIILKNKIPLLFKDPDWIKLFGNTGDKNIRETRNELIKLLQDEKNMKRTRIILEKEKKDAMKMILNIADAINKEQKTEDFVSLDEYKEDIEEINKELDELELRMVNMSQDINQSNFNLLKATVYFGYKDLKNKEKKLNKTIEELERSRERLKYLINEKHDYEEWIDSTYSFLHDVLGSEEMEKLDEKIF